jgi:hypothetical protein
MRFQTIVLAGAFLFAATAAWADDPMANTYANTVHTTNKATGAQGSLMFNQNNTYTANATGPDGKPVSYTGAWSMKDGGKTICLTPNIPNANPPPPTSCSPLEMHKIGDTWTVSNDQHETFDVTITAGR